MRESREVADGAGEGRGCEMACVPLLDASAETPLKLPPVCVWGGDKAGALSTWSDGA